MDGDGAGGGTAANADDQRAPWVGMNEHGHVAQEAVELDERWLVTRLAACVGVEGDVAVRLANDGDRALEPFLVELDRLAGEARGVDRCVQVGGGLRRENE